jgi:hypothetical protein
LFLLLGSVEAAPVSFQFSGKLTQVPLDEVFGDIAPGDAIQANVNFDSSATDLVPVDPATGSYAFSAPFGMIVMIGTHDFTASGFLNIGILNSFVDQYTVLATSSSGDLTLELFFEDDTGSAFADDHLPLAAPPLADFSQRDFHLDFTSALGELQADGQFDAPASAAIPEPALPNLILASSIILLASIRPKRFANKSKRSI